MELEKEKVVYAYVQLIHGDNDDHLPWPFTGTVNIKLLNQLKNSCHHHKSIEFEKHGSGRDKRVKDGDRASSACLADLSKRTVLWS